MIDKQKFFSKTYVVICGALICCLLWGSAFPCVKLGYQLFNVDTTSVPSLILFAGLRFSLAGVMVIAFACVSQKKFVVPKKSSLWKILVLCLFQTVGQYVFFYIGLPNIAGYKILKKRQFLPKKSLFLVFSPLLSHFFALAISVHNVENF